MRHLILALCLTATPLCAEPLPLGQAYALARDIGTSMTATTPELLAKLASRSPTKWKIIGGTDDANPWTVLGDPAALYLRPHWELASDGSRAVDARVMNCQRLGPASLKAHAEGRLKAPPGMDDQATGVLDLQNSFLDTFKAGTDATTMFCSFRLSVTPADHLLDEVTNLLAADFAQVHKPDQSMVSAEEAKTGGLVTFMGIGLIEKDGATILEISTFARLPSPQS